MIKRNSTFTSYNPESSGRKADNERKIKHSNKGKPYFLEQGYAGFTLTEIVVSIAILILIIGSIFSLLISNQRAYQKGEAASEVVQNGRIILEKISREIRQTDEIVTPLPDVPDNPGNPPPDEILFHDGHTNSVTETGAVQAATQDSITLAADASSENDYYEDMFIKITSGIGSGQIRQIDDYDGLTKIAEIKNDWDTIPDNTSTYKIDTSYYYIYYFKDGTNVKRQVLTYYFSGDSDTYVPENVSPPVGETLEQQILDEEIVGEYVTSLKFWQSPVVNIAISLEKEGKAVDLQTKVFARNL